MRIKHSAKPKIYFYIFLFDCHNLTLQIYFEECSKKLVLLLNYQVICTIYQIGIYRHSQVNCN